MQLPILGRFEPGVSVNEINRAKKLAARLMVESPSLNWRNDEYCDYLIKGEITDHPTLHLDDFSEIPVIGKNENSRILQQRARLRACNGDYVAQSRTVERGFSDYCEYHLGLGRVRWLYPAVAESNTRQIALECWQDRRLRHDLEQAMRHEGLRYLHPHISNRSVWELAALLHNSTRMPISVIGPTPALSNWVNDKTEFTSVVEKLLGEEFVPQTESAYNFASLSKIVARLSASHRRIAIKFPYGTGGNGNFLLNSECVRGQSLKQIRNYLKKVLENVLWPKGGRVLIEVWEHNVVNSPSIQTWIPPIGYGEPLIEGIFIQYITGEEGSFAGSSLASLPTGLEQQIVDQAFLLAKLFQELGYVGRCSFDLILVGDSVFDCRVEFIECNARWGGTSCPMTLMNRLGSSAARTYCIRQLHVPDLWRIEFADLERELEDELYKPSTGQGNLVLFNPAGINEQSSIDIIAMGHSQAEAEAKSQHASSRISAIIRCLIEPGSITGFLLDHADFDDVGFAN